MPFSLNHHYRYFKMFWPFRWSLIFVVGGAWAILFFIRSEQLIPSYSGEVLTLASKIFFVFFLIVPLFVGLMLLFFYLIFRFKKNKPNVTWKENRLEVSNLIQPFMGFVRVHLMKKENVVSDTILLLPSNESGIFFLNGTMISAPLSQSDVIRAEVIDGIVFHFEDPFRFFSFSTQWPIQIERFRLPDADVEQADWMMIKHPDREEQHTPFQQARAGDWFRLKSFESGDDVRRIVWNLYAKHKALMVRQQDIHQPYGDTLRVFVSFQITSSIPFSSSLLLFFESYYKQRLYALIGGLLKEELLIDWRTELFEWEKGITAESLAMKLSQSSFHGETSMHELSGSDSPSIVFISSIDDLTHVSTYSKLWPDAIFVQVDLERAIKPPSWGARLLYLLLEPRNNDSSEVQKTWWRNPLKRYVVKQGNELKAHLNGTAKEGGIYV